MPIDQEEMAWRMELHSQCSAYSADSVLGGGSLAWYRIELLLAVGITLPTAIHINS